MTFGALCDREYGFEYGEIKKRKGLAWYPLVTSDSRIKWVPNACYRTTSIDVRRPGDYTRLGIVGDSPLYQQASRDLERFAWVSNPALVEDVWQRFEP